MTFKTNYFISHSEEKILQNLVNANIIKFDDEYYAFSYKYIFYYLVAQKIANELMLSQSDIDNKKYETIIENLCKDIHLEKTPTY